MRERFAAFRSKSDAEFDALWKNAIFTFDANVLLGVYSFSAQSRDVFFSHLRALGGRSFLTNQAALEFYRNRIGVISNARRALERASATFEEIPAVFSEGTRKKFQQIFEEEHSQLMTYIADDPIEQELDTLFGDRVTEPLEVTEEVCERIDLRYLSGVPPGFSDTKEKQDYRKYGDAILWFELIAEAKSQNKSVIFVTSETKEDWWLKDGQGKNLRPRPELGHEVYREAGVSFHLYSLSEFLKFAPKYIKTDHDVEQRNSEAVSEAERIEHSPASKNEGELLLTDTMPTTSLEPNVLGLTDTALNKPTHAAPLWKVPNDLMRSSVAEQLSSLGSNSYVKHFNEMFALQNQIREAAASSSLSLALERAQAASAMRDVRSSLAEQLRLAQNSGPIAELQQKQREISEALESYRRSVLSTRNISPIAEGIGESQRSQSTRSFFARVHEASNSNVENRSRTGGNIPNHRERKKKVEVSPAKKAAKKPPQALDLK